MIDTEANVSTKRDAFKNWMKESIIVADGAIGTLLNLRGVPQTACKEEANLSRADLVADIHRDYVRAGAQILTTNTFKANRLHLATHDLASRVHEINVRGVTNVDGEVLERNVSSRFFPRNVLSL